MKLSLTIIKKGFGKIFRIREHPFALSGKSVATDWHILLTLIFLGLIVAIGANLYLFFGIKSGSLFAGSYSVEKKGHAISVAEVEQIAEKLKEQDEKFNEAKTGVLVKDPAK